MAGNSQTLNEPRPEPVDAHRSMIGMLAVCLAVYCVLPASLFWFFVGRVPTVTISEARAMCAQQSAQTALVDVRTTDAYIAGHVDGAFNWPSDDIAAARQMPEELRGRKLLLLCETGISSAWSAAALRQRGIEAWNVDGGTATWLAGADPAHPQATRFRESPVYAQWVASLSGFTIKPIYMILSLVVAWLLRRRREEDLVALRWAMLVFFTGEFFCYLNYFAFGDESHLVEYLHSYGMAAAMAFGIYAVFEGLDRRLIHYSAPKEKCAALPLCGPCIKYTDAACGLKRLFQMLIPLAMVLACLPFAAEPHAVMYDTQIVAVRYTYTHPLVPQMYEIWVCPLLALTLMAPAWIVLTFGRVAPVAKAKALFAAGLGLFGFGLLRLLLFAPFRDNLVWFQFWEEATELLGILAVLGVLLVFRRSLLAEKESAPESR